MIQTTEMQLNLVLKLIFIKTFIITILIMIFKEIHKILKCERLIERNICRQRKFHRS